MSLADSVPETEDLMDQEDDAPDHCLINALLSEAIRLNAQIFTSKPLKTPIGTLSGGWGALKKSSVQNGNCHHYWCRVLKVMAKLDIAENGCRKMDASQLRLAGREVDVRVSTLPSNFGERVVMRRLDKQSGSVKT